MKDLVKELMNHINKAKDAYAKAYNTIDVVTNGHKRKLSALNAQSRELTQEAFSEKRNAANIEYQKEVLSIKGTLDAEIEKISAEYMKTLYEYYQPSGSAINDDLKLINSGIILTSKEVEILVAKNADNTTMLRLIGQYVGNHKINVSDEVNLAFYRALKAGELEKDAFRTFTQLAYTSVNMALSGNAGTTSYITSADKLEEYVKDTETKLKKAKVFLDEATRAELLAMEEEELSKRAVMIS